MTIFTASRFSNGNAIFPLEIHIDDFSFTIKKPGLISSNEKTMMYRNISSVELFTPVFGFTKIKFRTIGLDSFLAEGFERFEAEAIRDIIHNKIIFS